MDNDTESLLTLIFLLLFYFYLFICSVCFCFMAYFKTPRAEQRSRDLLLRSTAYSDTWPRESQTTGVGKAVAHLLVVPTQ